MVHVVLGHPVLFHLPAKIASNSISVFPTDFMKRLKLKHLQRILETVNIINKIFLKLYLYKIVLNISLLMIFVLVESEYILMTPHSECDEGRSPTDSNLLWLLTSLSEDKSRTILMIRGARPLHCFIVECGGELWVTFREEENRERTLHYPWIFWD